MTKEILDPMPGPELLGPVLDISRPELEVIVKRYEEAELPATDRTPVALVVERPGLRNERIKEALASAGWRVTSCSGPSATSCPLMCGAKCGLREEADVAVVYVDRRGSTPTSSLPRISCAAHPASPAVVAIEGSVRSAAFAERSAIVGGLRDPQTIIETIDRLLLGSETDR